MDKFHKLKKRTKKKKPYEKKEIFRLMAILDKLANRKMVATRDLAEEFRVSKRTIQRDMILLEGIGVPLYFENNVYKVTENFSLRKISVTREEKYLLMLLYRLFSRVGQPFDVAAKKLLDKVLKSSSSPEEAVDRETTKIIEREFKNFSDSLAKRVRGPKYTQPFIEKIDEYLAEVEAKLERKEKSDVAYKLYTEYEHGKPIAMIMPQRQRFKEGIEKIEHFKKVCVGPWMIKVFLPDAENETFRRVLCLYLYVRSVQGHIDEKSITCFDDFAEYLDFPKESRKSILKYISDTVPGALTVVGQLTWEKEIPMSNEDLKPYLDKNKS